MFKDITSRFDASNASLDLLIMLGVACLLGFLYCYFRHRHSGHGE